MDHLHVKQAVKEKPPGVRLPEARVSHDDRQTHAGTEQIVYLQIDNAIGTST